MLLLFFLANLLNNFYGKDTKKKIQVNTIKTPKVEVNEIVEKVIPEVVNDTKVLKRKVSETVRETVSEIAKLKIVKLNGLNPFVACPSLYRLCGG